MYRDECVTFRAVPKSSLKLFLRYGTVIGFCSEHTPFFTHAGSKIRRAFDRRTVNYHRCRGNDCQRGPPFLPESRTGCTSLSPPVNSCTWPTRTCLLKSNPTDVRRAPWGVSGRGAQMSASALGFAMVKAILIIVSALTVIVLMAWFATHGIARPHRTHGLRPTQGKSIAGLSSRQRVLLRKGGRLPL